MIYVYHSMSSRNYLVTLLPQLGYTIPSIIVNKYDQGVMWLLESGCQGPFEFPDEVLTDPLVAEDNEIEVTFINEGHSKDTSHIPVKRNVNGILELLKELSGKEWFFIMMGDSQDEFWCLDDLDGWEVLKDSFTVSQQSEDGTWSMSFDRYEDIKGGGEIITLSEQMIKDIISHL